MIRSNLAELMSQRKLTASALARYAGINRSTVAALAHNHASRIELDVLERLCVTLQCALGDLLEIVPEHDEPRASSTSPEK